MSNDRHEERTHHGDITIRVEAYELGSSRYFVKRFTKGGLVLKPIPPLDTEKDDKITWGWDQFVRAYQNGDVKITEYDNR